MSEPTMSSLFKDKGNTLIVAGVVVVLIVAVLWFVDRQQARKLEMQRIEQRIDVLEEWGPPAQRAVPGNPPRQGGKVL